MSSPKTRKKKKWQVSEWSELFFHSFRLKANSYFYIRLNDKLCLFAFKKEYFYTAVYVTFQLFVLSAYILLLKCKFRGGWNFTVFHLSSITNSHLSIERLNIIKIYCSMFAGWLVDWLVDFVFNYQLLNYQMSNCQTSFSEVSTNKLAIISYKLSSVNCQLFKY